MSVPNWWETLLLVAAAYRLWRLVSYDVITEGWRTSVLDHYDATRTGNLSEWLFCPWCLGAWITGLVLAAYCLVYGWIGFFNFGVHWFAMSLAVGLIGTRLDTE